MRISPVLGLTVPEHNPRLMLGRDSMEDAMQDRIDIPKTPVSGFTWMMVLLAVLTIVATVIGFYVADPFR